MINSLGYLGGHNRIAFSAVTSSSSSYSGSSDVKFSTIITNVGNGFSHSTGLFTAPNAGVYVFEWSIRSYSGNNEYPGIYVNGKLMMVTHCYGYSSYYNSCSKTITLNLQKQDGVSIRSYSGTMYVAGTYSSFSGWML
ncbi:hypothetical protein FSP39_020626 [Pinctada imbricata]|uniref:C1q domain-containing protein n=1 Tax=Pinctada imbricata TaxID=66713 RepID=A0AA88YI09_PINIB|nr:hypothetical protein FSP39_020626 [Pinctada imbricata]